MPLFRIAWPDAKPIHLASLETAMRLAEESANRARPSPELKDAMGNLVRTAAASLAPISGEVAGAEPYPASETACRVAFSAIRATACAAEAAMNGAEESTIKATEAFVAARQAAESADSTALLKELERDLEKFVRQSRKERWSDSTPVASSVFVGLTEPRSDRKWWKFW